MVTNDTVSTLKEHGIADADIQSLQGFIGRDGFECLDENDFSGMMQFLQQEEELAHIVPVLTDENSNYLCVFVKGDHKGLVCYLSHDEINLTPIFKNITNMIQAINNHPDAWDVYDLPVAVFDFKELPF